MSMEILSISCFLCHGTQEVDGKRCPDCTMPTDEELQAWAEKNKAHGWKWFTEEKPPVETMLVVSIGGNYWLTEWYSNPGYTSYDGYVAPEAGFEDMECDDAFLSCECREVLWRLADFEKVKTIWE